MQKSSVTSNKLSSFPPSGVTDQGFVFLGEQPFSTTGVTGPFWLIPGFHVLTTELDVSGGAKCLAKWPRGWLGWWPSCLAADVLAAWQDGDLASVIHFTTVIGG